MNKIIPIVVVLAIALGGIFFLTSRNQKTTPSKEEEQPVKETVLPIEKRPYVSLVPREDGHELTMEITGLKDVDTVEYEFIYLAGGVSRGGIGSAEPKGENSVMRKMLFGSCSKNVCRYDEGVTEGTLTLRLRAKSGVQKYEVPFILEKGSKSQKQISLAEGKFQFNGTLGGNTFYVVMSTVGLPKVPDGKIVGGPYGIFSSGVGTIKGTVKVTMDEASPNAKVLGFDSKTSSWNEITNKLDTDGQTISVDIDKVTTYTAVSN